MTGTKALGRKIPSIHIDPILQYEGWGLAMVLLWKVG